LFAYPSSIVVGNDSILPVTSVYDSVLPKLFYLNDVLVTPGLVQSLISVCWFTTDNFYSMEFNSFGLSVKGATTYMLARYDSISLLYTLLLPTLPTPTPRVVPYVLAAAAS
jgi:hypothetical protein